MNPFDRESIASNPITRTNYKRMSREDLVLMRHLAIRAIADDSLVWRHNGQGLLQAYLFEGDRVEGRIHVWHDELKKSGIVDNGLYHDHRFDMKSHVILGTIEHSEIALRPIDEEHATTRIVEVTCGRETKQKNGGEDYDMDPVTLPGWYNIDSTSFLVRHSTYTFPRFRFHKALNKLSPTVTIVLKSNQVDDRARLLDQFRYGPLINCFEDTLQPGGFSSFLEEAHNKLIGADDRDF